MYLFKPYQFKIHQPSSSQCPRARSGHRVVCNEKYLYSYGGYNPQIRIDDPEMSKDDIWLESKPLFKELWRFNLSTNEWKRMSGQKNYPIELASTAVILRGNKLIIFGGTAVPFGESCSNHLYVCNIDDGSIRKIEATGSLPNPQYGQALICHNNYLYTVGGTTGYGYECHIHRCNLSTGIWETVYICSGSDEMEPAGRYRHELAYDGKMIYVLGGGTVNQSFGFLEIPAFNLITNKWTSIHTHGDVNCNSEVPQPRRCHGAVQYTDDETGNIQVVISGGYTGLRRFDDMWRLDLVRRQWTRLKSHSLPCRVYFHSVGLTPFGKMYTFGGIIGDNSDPPKRTRKVHSIWLKIPKLTEICWEALNYYHKDLKERTRDQLLDYGIPIKFIQRLEDDVFRVPETATVLLSGGIKFSDLTEAEALKFQENLLRTMIQIENTFFQLGESCNRNCLIICDRGAMDASAFISKDKWDQMMSTNGWNNVDLRDTRYNQIIHMVSAVNGAEEFYSTEDHACRSEGVELARELDYKAAAAWVGHPYFDVIDNSQDFESKICRMIECICQKLGIDTGDRLRASSRKVKFLVKGPLPPDSEFPPFQDFDVVHNYLESKSSSQQARLRKRGQKGHWSYIHTIRRPKMCGQVVEVKTQISHRDYLNIVTSRDDSHFTIFKKRRCFLINNQYFQLDIYREPAHPRCRGLMLLETYTALYNDDLKNILPTFLSIEKDVTGNPDYSMFNLSLREEWHTRDSKYCHNFNRINDTPIDFKTKINGTTDESIINKKCMTNGINGNAKNDETCVNDKIHNGINGKTMNGYSESHDTNGTEHNKSNGNDSQCNNKICDNNTTNKADDNGIINDQSCKNTFKNTSLKI